MNANLSNMSWGKWIKSPNQFNTYINHKGDKITFLNRHHALINGVHFRGFLAIYGKIQELNNSHSF